MDCLVEDGGKGSLLEVTLLKCGDPGGSELGDLRPFCIQNKGHHSHTKRTYLKSFECVI